MSAAYEKNTIYVSNINYKTVGEALCQAFERFGIVARVRIITGNTYWGKEVSRGFGFVEFKDADGMNKALDFKEEIDLDGRRLFIREAREPRHHKRDTAFIANIPAGTTEDDLKAIFAKYHPTAARIVKTAAPGATSGGFGFVTFASEEDQTNAVTENRTVELKGVESIVRFARPPGRSGYWRGFASVRSKARRAGPKRAPRGKATAQPEKPNVSKEPAHPAKEESKPVANTDKTAAKAQAKVVQEVPKPVTPVTQVTQVPQPDKTAGPTVVEEVAKPARRAKRSRTRNGDARSESQ
jgi:RNA recognition motif-containing protein